MLFTHFSGYIPCKVISLERSTKTCVIRLTATRGAYKAGERMTVSVQEAIPKRAVKLSRQKPGHYYNTAYQIEYPIGESL